MLTIGEVVALDEQARFHNDVQISAFDDPVKNVALLRSYLFTSTAPNTEMSGARTVSSLELLDYLVQAFLSDRLENRMAAVANYGHGKSHLALALANFFSRPAGTEEVKVLLSKITRAASDPAKARRFQQFKENSGEFLVVRIRGDEPHSLREQVFAGIEKSVDEHPATTGRRPKFWFASAETYLLRLAGADLDLANDYLEPFGLDVPQLMAQVKQHKDVYARCVAVFTHLHGVPPNFGGEVSLKQAIDWTVETCCGPSGPLRGVVILFDEFSSYLDRHAHHGAALELQDLLNGVEDKPGKVVFLAFAQHDPMTLVGSMSSLQAAARDGLARALTRIPKRFVLFSLMESVIDAYLVQNTAAWTALVQNPKVKGSVFQATDVAFEQFKNRYQRDLHWSFEQFQETVTKGCFPLHPITTVLLTNLRYSATGDFGVPRTVLGFVLEQLARLSEEAAIFDSRVNWVLPIYLVDYFEPRLKGESYSAYKNAVRRLDAEAPLEQEAVLKALLLFNMADLKATGDDQVHFLAQCAGINEHQTAETLKTLAGRRCLRYDRVRRLNTFVDSGDSPEKLEELVTEKLDALSFTANDILTMEATVSQIEGVALASIPVSVPWGDATDWAAHETLLPARFVTWERLQDLAHRFEAQAREISAGDRGCVVWLWATSEEELAGLRSMLTAAVDNAFAETAPIPVVFILPNEATPELLTAYQRFVALDDFSPEEQERVGQKTFDDEVLMSQANLVHALDLLRGEQANCLDIVRSIAAFRVPRAYRAEIEVLPKPTVRKVLEASYRAAYRGAPPAFFTHYKLSNARQKAATKMVANLLLENSPEALRQAIRPDNVAVDLCNKFLKSAWGIQTGDFRIQEPTSQAVRRAWQLLDEAFPPGCSEKAVRDPILALLNPPYGYDVNTATLLFCSWFGYHSHDLQVSILGRLANRNALVTSLTNGPKEFINEICITRPLALARRDHGHILKDVRRLLDKLQSDTFTQEQAQQDIAALEEFALDARNNADIRAMATNGASTLRGGFEAAREYDRQVAEIQRGLKSTDLQAMLGLRDRIGKLPALTLVATKAQSPAELRQVIQDRLTEVTEYDCGRFGKLENLTQLEHLQNQLRLRRGMVQKAGLEPQVMRFDLAIAAVLAKAEQLEVAGREEAVRVEIRNMDLSASLTKLRRYHSRLEEIAGQSDETMKLRDERLQAVNLQIDQLKSKAASWTSRIDSIASLATLQQDYNDLLRTSSRYDDGELTAVIEQAQLRLENVREYMLAVAALQGNADGKLRNQADVQALLDQAGALRQQYGDQLSPKQMALLDAAVAIIQQDAESKIARALVWLRERQEEYATTSPVALKQQLQKLPAFLPDEARQEWNRLMDDVQRKIDQDLVMSIEQKFLEITDINQRRQCIQRLERHLQPVTYQ